MNCVYCALAWYITNLSDCSVCNALKLNYIISNFECRECINNFFNSHGACTQCILDKLYNKKTNH